MNPISHFFNYFYLTLCIIWQPLQLYYLKVDGAGRTILILSIVALIINLSAFSRQSHIMRSPAFMCWTALVLFSIVNSSMKGFLSEDGWMAFYKTNYIVPYAFLYVIVIELDWDFDTCLKLLFYALLTYILMSLGYMSNITRGKDERMMAEGLGNLLPLHSICLVYVSGLLYKRQALSSVIWGVVVSISVVVSVLSGTRKALGAILILLAGIFLQNDNGTSRDFKYYIKLALFFAAAYWGIEYLMDNTMIGERLANTAEQSDVIFVENKSANMFLNALLGDRAIQYELGYLAFLKHPLTGIGITNFMPVTGFPYRLHTEYMTQLCENGIIGFSLLLLFYILIIKKTIQNHIEYGDNIIIELFGMLAILFLNITTWTYNQNFGMIYYGILIAYAYTNFDDVSIGENGLEWYDETEEASTEET